MHRSRCVDYCRLVEDSNTKTTTVQHHKKAWATIPTLTFCSMTIIHHPQHPLYWENFIPWFDSAKPVVSLPCQSAGDGHCSATSVHLQVIIHERTDTGTVITQPITSHTFGERRPFSGLALVALPRLSVEDARLLPAPPESLPAPLRLLLAFSSIRICRASWGTSGCFAARP